jgi:hypothetical protein
MRSITPPGYVNLLLRLQAHAAEALLPLLVVIKTQQIKRWTKKRQQPHLSASFSTHGCRPKLPSPSHSCCCCQQTAPPADHAPPLGYQTHTHTNTLPVSVVLHVWL